MTQPATSILTGRLGRTAKVGGLLGGEVARTYAAKAANLGRSPEDRRDADGRRRLQAASHGELTCRGFPRSSHEHTRSHAATNRFMRSRTRTKA
jgi:hypothetical protein